MRLGTLSISAAVAALLALIAPTATVGAASKSPKLAKCDGKQRRAANPYGSILPTIDPLSGASTPASQEPDRTGVHVFPDPASSPSKPVRDDGTASPQVPPISAAIVPTAYRSC